MPLHKAERANVADKLNAVPLYLIGFHSAKGVVWPMATGTIEISKVFKLRKTPSPTVTAENQYTLARLRLIGRCQSRFKLAGIFHKF